MPEVALQLTHPAQADDDELLDALRQGDEGAYVALVRRYGGLMQRVALSYVRTPAVAEEVVQETWCAVLTGLERFEGRAALKTWLFRILTNRAKTRGQREARTVPFSSLAGEDDVDGPAVDPDRFLPADHPQWPGHWASGPAPWSAVPDERLLAREVRAHIREAIDTLPSASRRSSCCATSTVGRPRRSARCSASARATSACCCTARGRRCARSSSATSPTRSRPRRHDRTTSTSPATSSSSSSPRTSRARCRPASAPASTRTSPNALTAWSTSPSSTARSSRSGSPRPSSSARPRSPRCFASFAIGSAGWPSGDQRLSSGKSAS